MNDEQNHWLNRQYKLMNVSGLIPGLDHTSIPDVVIFADYMWIIYERSREHPALISPGWKAQIQDVILHIYIKAR